MSHKRKTKKFNREIIWFFAIVPFLYGGFYEWIYCLCGVILLFLLSIRILSERKIKFSKDISFVGFFVIAIFYSGTIFCGIDSGTSIVGIIRYVVVLLLLMLTLQCSVEEKKLVLNKIPELGSIMVLLAGISYFCPWKNSFYQAERLGGFFQYSNTFALYLLFGILVLAYQKKWKKFQIAEAVILTAGILFTGSRSVFVLLIGNGIYFAIKERTYRKKIIGMLIGLCILSAVGILILGNRQTIGRIFTLFGQSSTLWGRLLYAEDGIRMLLKYPMGLGYLGYYFLQPSMQTGVYTTKFVHNEFLQIGLDAGILAMGILILIFIKQLFSKEVKGLPRHLLWMIAIHSLVDFDLQFLSIWIVAAFCMDFSEKREIEIKVPLIVKGIVVILSCIFLFVGSAVFAEYRGNYKTAVRIMPRLTTAQLQILSSETNLKQVESMTEAVLKQNQMVSQPYGVKAEIAFEKGNGDELIKNKREEILKCKYEVSVYEDYVEKLSVMITKLSQRDDVLGIQKYMKEILWVKKQIKKVNESTSPLAFCTRDNPELMLEEHYEKYINEIEVYYKEHFL